jgi:hypothetical protein
MELIQYCKKSELKQLKKDELFYEELLKLSPKTNNSSENTFVKTPVRMPTRQALNKPQVNPKNRGKSLQVGVRRK